MSQHGPGSAAGVVAGWHAAVQRWPDQPALRTDERTVTFAELDHASADVAAALVARGIGRGHRVALCLDHTVTLAQTLLGVLRAGAAFVPVDVRSAPARISRLVTIAGSDLVVTEPGAGLLEVPCPVIEAASLQCAQTAEDVDPDPADTAYIMFTSGSTGEPKGVVISHGALARYLDWARSYLRSGIGGVPLYSSIAFDLTITSLLAPLMAGRTVHLVPAESGIFGVAELLSAGTGFDLIKLTPSHLRMLLAAVADRPIASQVGCLVLGGEALPSELVRQWRAIMPASSVVNEYGPTEATVGCCVAEIAPGQPVPEIISIGRAIPGVDLHVLDDDAEPVEPGDVGELYIGGDTLADGYVNRPAATAERFVAHPLATSGRRVYRTGDIVRLGEDGELSYRGRRDDQVKIRGCRIELGEVTAAVRSHPGVADACVRAWRRADDDVRLVAHVVPRAGVAADELLADLLDQLEQDLPDFMVPSHLVPMTALPHTINGKVDTAKLPDPAG